MIFVLAGNKREFEEFCYKGNPEFPKGKNTAVYASSITQMFGYRVDSFLTIGTFWERSDASQLFECAKSRVIKTAYREII